MFFRSPVLSITALGAAALIASGCQEPLQPGTDRPAFATAAATLGVTGRGAIGESVALPGLNRQEFDFAITSPPAGRFFIRDYSTVRTGTAVVGSMTVDPADPATRISSFDQISAHCVTFGGIGRVDTGDLFPFSVTTCDNGTPGAGVDNFNFSVPDIGYSKTGKLNSGDVAISGATKGDIAVTTATTGVDLDPNGYTVTVNTTASQAIGTNGTADFKGLDAGSYVVELTGIAANCTLSGPASQTVAVTAGNISKVPFNLTCASTSTISRVVGLGVIGTGPALPKMDRFELDFDVRSDLTGRVLLKDYNVVRSDGEIGTMTVDPADPATFISSFGYTSANCVSFGGRGRLNDGTGTYRFFIEACDNASPGAGADTFSANLPDRPYSKSGTLSQGDIAITRTTP